MVETAAFMAKAPKPAQEQIMAWLKEGVAAGDFTRAHATVGEATGLIHDVPDAASAIARMHAQALAALGAAA